jgi:uncharacterized protein with ATP-grasp and redox domains
MIRQASESIQLVTKDPLRQEEAMKSILQAMYTMLSETPVATRVDVHKMVRDKKLSNEIGKKLYPKLKQIVKDSQNPLPTAIRLAIAGNIVDFGAFSPEKINEEHILATIDKVLNATPAVDDTPKLIAAINAASDILYIADNCGELFFDRVLIEELPLHKVTFVVCGYPFLNDATYEDARETGLTDIISVIDTGSGSLLIENWKPSVREAFNQADLVIVKGQGRYGTMKSLDRELFCLLIAKCNVVARDVGCQVGDIIIEAAGRENRQGNDI